MKNGFGSRFCSGLPGSLRRLLHLHPKFLSQTNSIECRLTDHCEHFTGAWIQRYDRPHVFAGIVFGSNFHEHVFSGTLKVKINGGYKIVARDCFCSSSFPISRPKLLTTPA